MKVKMDIDVKAREFIDLQSICRELDLREATDNDTFKYCLSVILEQDAYSIEEMADALEVIRLLTNNDEGFTIIEEVQKWLT